MRYHLALPVLALTRSFAIATSDIVAERALAERSDTGLVIGSETNAAASSTLTTSGNGTSLVGMNGDAVCTSALCIGALVNGSDVQYTLQSLGGMKLGWMAMGFGTSMANSPMVIMWPNSDGSITLSQRTAPGEVMPTVDDNPPFTATLLTSMSSTNGSNPKFSYKRPSNSSGSQNIIWAFGTTDPGSSAVDATLVQHSAFGKASLNLAKTLNTTSRNPLNPVSNNLATTDASPPSGGDGDGDGDDDSGAGPLTSSDKMLIAHGILTAVGFLVVLPFGALIARYLRTFTPAWFTGHWVFQFVFGLPIIVAGVALAIAEINKGDGPHFDDNHQRWGLAIFVLYFVQLLGGALAHWWKPKYAGPGFRRPVHNYVHAVVGLFLIAISFYQVRTGFRVEWPEATGRGNVSNAANIIWYIWVVLMPVLYFAGLLLLRRQFRQEAESQRLTSSSDEARLTTGETEEHHQDMLARTQSHI